MTSTQTTLEDVIVEAINSALLQMHTGLPAKVVKFDALGQSCDVQPLLMSKIATSNPLIPTKLVTLPIITNVPVQYPSWGDFAITAPLALGDVVFLAFAERSIDSWLAGTPGQVIDPQEARHHDLSDAIAIPGIRQRTAPLVGLASPNLTIGKSNGATVLEITPDGQVIITAELLIKLGGAGAVASFVKGEDLLLWLATHTHPSAALGPPSPPTVPPPTSMLSTKIKGT